MAPSAASGGVPWFRDSSSADWCLLFFFNFAPAFLHPWIPAEVEAASSSSPRPILFFPHDSSWPCPSPARRAMHAFATIYAEGSRSSGRISPEHPFFMDIESCFLEGGKGEGREGAPASILQPSPELPARTLSALPRRCRRSGRRLPCQCRMQRATRTTTMRRTRSPPPTRSRCW